MADEDSASVSQFRAFLTTATRGVEEDAESYKALVMKALIMDGPRRSVVIHWEDLARELPMQAELLLTQPQGVMDEFSTALRLVALDLDMEEGREKPLVWEARFTGFPPECSVPLSGIREDRLGHIVSVRGVVQSVSETRPRCEVAVFQCGRCGVFMREAQDEHLTLKEPLECYQDQGGCGRDATFKFIMAETRGQVSSFVDMQAFYLQEAPDSVQGTRTPERVPCYILGDWCGRVMPSERITVHGVLRSKVRTIQKTKTNMMDYFIDASSFTCEESTYEDIQPTPQEIEQFQAWAADPELRENLIGSVAPSISGRREAKLAILLQLFGGVAKPLPDGRKARGDIHVLLIGDPGQGKSALGEAAALLSPRGQFATALDASAAGIVGGVEKQDKGLGGETWVYQAGLVSMVHKGFLFLDEIDKPKDKDLLNRLLVPLEQQVVVLNKMGARGLKLPAEFSMLAGANPKNGRFDMQASDLASQISIPAPFLDRMDLAFVLDDGTDEKRDLALVDTILKGHMVGAAHMQRKTGHGTYEVADDLAESLKPKISPDLLRKYIAHARRTYNPGLSDEATARIRTKYVLVRRRRGGNPDAPTSYSPRTLNALVRLSEASARMRLSNLIEDEDVDLAFDVFKAGWERLATNAKGELDMDRLGAAMPADMRSQMKTLKQICTDLAAEYPNRDGPEQHEIIAAATRAGLERDFVVKSIRRMVDSGQLFKAGKGGWILDAPVRTLKEATKEVKP